MKNVFLDTNVLIDFLAHNTINGQIRESFMNLIVYKDMSDNNC